MKFFILSLGFVSAQVGETVLQFGKGGGTASINVRSSNPFVIRMATNPTTGYDWHLTGSLPPCVHEVSRSHERPDTGLIGAPSVLQLTYATTGTCVGELEYAYTRAWDTESPRGDDVQYVRVHVSVSDGIEL